MPGYKLRQCHEDGEPFGYWRDVTFISLQKQWQSFQNVMWDDDQLKYVTFSEANELLRKVTKKCNNDGVALDKKLG